MSQMVLRNADTPCKINIFTRKKANKTIAFAISKHIAHDPAQNFEFNILKQLQSA
jgi:hypothetical protein